MLSKKHLSLVLLLFIIVINIPNISHGNAAEPPSIMIIVANPPDDLEISIGEGDTYAKAKEVDKVLERYYTFYTREIGNASEYPISIKSNDISYEIVMEDTTTRYQNIYTLNLELGTLSPGKSLSRSVMLVSMRVNTTLLIEGIVFWLLGFREKRSWIVFIIINLITQGALNIWINGLFPIQSYLFIGLIFLEILILIVESTVVLSKVKEHKKSRRFLYVLSANLLSLVVGGYILTVLPF